MASSLAQLAFTVSPAKNLARASPSRSALRSSFVPTSTVLRSRAASLHHSVDLAHRRATPFVTSAAATTTQGTDIMSSLVGFFKRLLPMSPSDSPTSPEDDPMPEGGRTVAVLGATGGTGKYVVTGLLDAGHKVSILAMSEDKAKEVLEQELGVELGGSGRRGVRLVEGSIQDPEAVKDLLQGCDAVICCTGSRRGPDGFAPGSSPEDVDWRGVSEVVRASISEFERAQEEGKDNKMLQADIFPLFDFSSSSPSSEATPDASSSTNGSLFPQSQRLPDWFRVDDVIMGGQSESILRSGTGSAVFEGEVRVEGGGFCGTRTKFPEPIDASEYDGIRLRVKGDGKRYKLNTRDNSMAAGELQYQASFDTVRGKWVDVFVPFSRFRAVEKARNAPEARPLDLTQLAGMAIIMSRFQYNGFPNPLFQDGKFSLEIESVSLERKPRPQFVLLSSAAVERSARAETPQEREASIPIVKLNPAGVLSWKLSGEDYVRSSGLQYTVVRPCGLTDKDEDEKFILESAQGDAITGLISRQEAAAVCVEALASPFATNVTFEVRRDDYSKGLGMTEKHWSTLFSRLRPDAASPLVQYPAVPEEMAAAFKG